MIIDFVDQSFFSLGRLSFYNIALICVVSQVLVHPAKGGPGFELLRRGGGQSEEEVEKGGNFWGEHTISIPLTKFINWF